MHSAFYCWLWILLHNLKTLCVIEIQLGSNWGWWFPPDILGFLIIYANFPLVPFCKRLQKALTAWGGCWYPGVNKERSEALLHSVYLLLAIACWIWVMSPQWIGSVWLLPSWLLLAPSKQQQGSAASCSSLKPLGSTLQWSAFLHMDLFVTQDLFK